MDDNKKPVSSRHNRTDAHMYSEIVTVFTIPAQDQTRQGFSTEKSKQTGSSTTNQEAGCN